MGFIEPADKPALYTLANVFVYPSFFEGFGFPPLEAQTYDCPVVTSNRSSLPEILKDSTIQINPWQTDRLAEAIIKLLNNKLLKNKLVKLGQKNIILE